MMKYFNLKQTTLDPYQILKSKSNRTSWNGLSDTQQYIDKTAVIEWFSLLRLYSEDLVKAIIVDGILESEFHKITFILNLVQNPEFQSMSSMQVYQLLYEFVCKTPQGILAWIDEKDFLMSRDVLAILSRNR
ncbi:hypothetical protein VCSRO56_3573 [Vibrio cholerae]|nr:hypothetical protein VCSRO56_3573 [Vibrio cholerae]GHW72538.1 hypothetical protein VCSRO103_3473 [Vibrio cholerae]GIB24629.1 hypothetical protein VCSRO185_3451 [Vibrio cholerae]